MKNDLASARPWNGSKHKIFGSMKESEEQKANFELAKLAVNNFDSLLEALKQTLDALYNETHGKNDSAWIAETKEKASIAIANAEK